MLPKKLPVALALLGLAGSAVAASTDEPWYFGVKAGHGEKSIAELMTAVRRFAR